MDGPKLFLNGVPKPTGKTIFRSNLDGRSADHSGGDMPNCRSFVTQNFLSIDLVGSGARPWLVWCSNIDVDMKF